MYDVAIIGAGIIGTMTARALSRYKLKVLILEKENDVACGATKANSAIVHAGFDAEPGTLKARLNVEGSQMMEGVCRELGVKYKRNGSLVTAFSASEKEHIKKLYERGIENGVKGLEIIDKKALRTLEPNISDDVICALYAPTGAIICPYELAIAACGNAMDNGCELKREFTVENIEHKDGVFTIHSEHENVKARYIVNAAGIFSDKIASLIGDTSFTVNPRKGEYILLDNEHRNIVTHTVFPTPTAMGKGILVSPTVDGNILLGPTSTDIDDKEDNTTTKDGFSAILEMAKKNFPHLPTNSAITSFCGLRSTGSTGDFIINTPVHGFINAAGIESPGLSASPAIAEYIKELLKDDGLELIEKENYNPYRKPSHYFNNASDEEKNMIIQKNPAFGKIICRCEKISEGEIIEAIHQNPGASDLDGIKRRTRAQMGRCQGGFCMPLICEIISRELNIPLSEVTKSGNGSHIVFTKTKEGK